MAAITEPRSADRDRPESTIGCLPARSTMWRSATSFPAADPFQTAFPGTESSLGPTMLAPRTLPLKTAQSTHFRPTASRLTAAERVQPSSETPSVVTFPDLQATASRYGLAAAG